jgi:UDP-N-acetylglucosamine 4,6-dehydratase
MLRELGSKNIEYYLGDVRDLERVKEASNGVDIIIHTAAMKRMDNNSVNTYEVASVNILGTYNIMRVSANKRVVVVSSDKAFSPSCTYGASKMIAENIALAYPNAVVWRFGNFIGSRGSVWEVFQKQKKEGLLTVTDPKATRFVISIDEVCDYVLSKAKPGLHYPTKLKKMTVEEIAKSVAPGIKYKVIGLREGEKLHEAFTHDYTSKK